jgi:hypothetical protein
LTQSVGKIDGTLGGSVAFSHLIKRANIHSGLLLPLGSVSWSPSDEEAYVSKVGWSGNIPVSGFDEKTFVSEA